MQIIKKPDTDWYRH